MKDALYIASSCSADIAVNDTRHYKQFIKWAIDGYRRMNMAGVVPTIKSTVLPINPDHSAYLPDDYIDYTKIGIYACGVVCNLDMNTSIFLGNDNTPLPACDCATIESEITQCFANNVTFPDGGMQAYFPGYWQYMDHYHNGQYTQGYYGKGDGFHGGGYRIDLHNMKIQLDSYVHAEKIVLEYQSSGINEEGNFYIPEIAVEALRNYVHWQRCRFSRDRIENGKAEGHRRQFNKEVLALNHKLQSFTAFEFLNSYRNTIKQIGKR